jgi:CMP-N,N'-diacetyllegionaminic acid synthase
MFILGLVAARSGSKGIPHKNIKLLGNKPLVSYTIECAMKSRAFTHLVVSTDDEEVAAVARGYEIPVIARPAVLATDTASKWDVFKHIVQKIECDILVDLDTGCPFREPEDITDTLRILRMGEADCVMTAYEAERNPYFNMVEIDESGKARISSINNGWQIDPQGWAIFKYPFIRRQDAPPVYSLSPSVLAIHAKALTKFSHWSKSNMQINIIPRARALDLDTPDDWEYAEWLISRKD